MLLLYNEENKIVGVTNKKQENTIEYLGDNRIPYQSEYKAEEGVIITPLGDIIELNDDSKKENRNFILEEV